MYANIVVDHLAGSYAIKIPIAGVVFIFALAWVFLAMAATRRRRIEPSTSALSLSLSAVAVRAACEPELGLHSKKDVP